MRLTTVLASALVRPATVLTAAVPGGYCGLGGDGIGGGGGEGGGEGGGGEGGGDGGGDGDGGKRGGDGGDGGGEGDGGGSEGGGAGQVETVPTRLVRIIPNEQTVAPLE